MAKVMPLICFAVPDGLSVQRGLDDQLSGFCHSALSALCCMQVFVLSMRACVIPCCCFFRLVFDDLIRASVELLQLGCVVLSVALLHVQALTALFGSIIFCVRAQPILLQLRRAVVVWW